MARAKRPEPTNNGLSLTDACRQSGVPLSTAKDRIARGWEFDRAATTPVNNRVGQQIKDNVRTSFDKVWAKSGQKQFEEQLKEAFDKDALKVVRDFLAYLPKEALERLEPTEKAVVRIEFNQPMETPRIILENDGG